MEGYVKLAELMACATELGIFRRFGTLNVQNLLYLQAELTHLESELRTLEKADRDSGGPFKSVYCHDWWHLSQVETEETNSQWQKFLELRSKLKEYSEFFTTPP